MKDCLIIGAGISGLMAARTLIGKGINVTIIDKSAGVGGRMATRRIGDGVFDHGAQFFTVRSDTLRKYVTSWEERGIVHEWCRGFLPGKPEGHARYIGTSGMTGIAKFLAADLDLRLNQRALFVSERNRKWHVLTDRDETIEADALILTPPVPQSLALIQTAQAGKSIGYRTRDRNHYLQPLSRSTRDHGAGSDFSPAGWITAVR